MGHWARRALSLSTPRAQGAPLRASGVAAKQVSIMPTMRRSASRATPQHFQPAPA
jgi:hypothetical protein